MARPIVLSNGELHVGLNNYGLVHDLYYPYVGLENHASGANTRHRVGVWIDGAISWLDDGSWTFSFDYPHDALIGHTTARSDARGILIEFDDFVDTTLNAFVRNIHVVNLWDHAREVRLFLHQAFVIGDSRSNTDTAQYLPDSDAILHYRGRRAFVVGAIDTDGRPFDQHSIGVFGIEGHEGTYRDADDGELSCSSVEHGQVDSTLRFSLAIGAHSSERVQYWIAAGTSSREALYIDKQLRQHGISSRLHQTRDWWHTWLAPALRTAKRLPEAHRDMFVRSVMIMKSQMDKRGAVIASTDSSMLNYSRDAYAYCWPRDGAFVLWPLIRMGYTEEPRRFFEFCRNGMHPNGYLMQKYRADGGLGASWHSYVHEDGVIAPPIQEDETAATLFVFSQFYAATKNERLLHEFYGSMVRPMADWMADYIDETTGLPKPSYDLWEEVFLTTTYTTATVCAALDAAAILAEAVSDSDSAVKWRSSAEDIRRAAHKHLYNKERKAFYKGVRTAADGTISKDDTIDTSSVYGAFMFGLFPADSTELTSAVTSVEATFKGVSSPLRVPRYEWDPYHRVDPESKGNWWFVTSLWMAQYYLEVGRTEEAYAILDWTREHALGSGVLSEQISTVDTSLVSPAPLTWSHAEYVATLLDTLTGE